MEKTDTKGKLSKLFSRKQAVRYEAHGTKEDYMNENGTFKAFICSSLVSVCSELKWIKFSD